jgi:hypothetical protein
MLKGWETPCQRVQTWAAGLSDEVQRELVVLLLGEACGLQEDMEALGRARGRQARALLLEDAWRRRDAMQSVWVLLSGEAGKVVESVLTGLDALMRGLLPGLRRVPVRVDDHLGAASWQEVGEWWVDLVEHPER